MPEAGRAETLVQIVDAALAHSVRRSGSHLACRPGCAQCCQGVFAISPLDTFRLRAGLHDLARTDPARAQRIRRRTADAVAQLSPTFPGDPISGHLGTSEPDAKAFEDFANEAACPALDPRTQTCDLYSARPMLCRTFGPPLATPEGGLAICDLCFTEASPVEIEFAQLDRGILGAEELADADHLDRTGEDFRTIVAFALAPQQTPRI